MMPLLIGALAMMITRMRWQAVVMLIAAASAALTMPMAVLPLATMGGLVAAIRRWRKQRRLADRLAAEVAALCDLVAISLTGGLGLGAALVLASEGIGGEVEEEVACVLRRARVDGLSAAMADASGAGRRLCRLLARASLTGSEVAGPVQRLADEMNAEQATERLEAVRRMPVLMLFPLTTLILPGFLLLAIAPAIIDAFTRLDF